MNSTFLQTLTCRAKRLPVWGLAMALAGCHGTQNPARHSSAEARARRLVARMTLPEKILELHGDPSPQHFRHLAAIPKLGIPRMRLANGPAGVGPADDQPQQPATALPAPISLAASWNPQLAYSYGVIIGKEARARGYALIEGPDINLARVPQNGRTFEAFGEDPLLTAAMAVGEIRGIQSRHVIADVKHYDANNQETGRFSVNEQISRRTLHEMYLPAFRASVVRGHAAAVMCAYPKINGVFNCQNSYLLETVLKRGWHFRGFVTSDFGATHSTVRSARAGLDLEMPGGHYFASKLEAAVQAGKVSQAQIDRKLVRRFATMIRLNVFTPWRQSPLPAKRDGAAALRIAERGMVLLKNAAVHGHPLLPIAAAGLHSIALIGPYAAHAITGGGGSSHVVPLYTVTPLSGLQARAGVDVKIRFNAGAQPQTAAALARRSQLAIVMVGDYETEGRDHPIAFSGDQNALVQAVLAANPRTIVVVKSGSAMLMPWADRAPAILEAWYPGEEDGAAVAAVLFGDYDPSGKLPLTFPRRLADLPAHTPGQYPGIPIPGAQPVQFYKWQVKPMQVTYSEGLDVGYRYYNARHLAPLFPFGFGLSYTHFRFSGLSITPAASSASPGNAVRVSFMLANTGQHAGAEVAQLYVRFPRAAGEPPWQLKGFRRVKLNPGESRRVTLSLPLSRLRVWNARDGWRAVPGSYRIAIGDSSRDLRLRGQLRLVAGR